MQQHVPFERKNIHNKRYKLTTEHENLRNYAQIKRSNMTAKRFDVAPRKYKRINVGIYGEYVKKSGVAPNINLSEKIFHGEEKLRHKKKN